MKKIITLLFLLLPLTALGQFGGGGGNTTLDLSSNVKTVKPGDSFQLLATLSSKNYSSYYNGSVGNETPLIFNFSTPKGVLVGLPQFPKPKIKEKQGKLTFVFPDQANVLFNVEVSDAFKGDSIDFKLKLASPQICNDETCLRPVDFEAGIKVAVSDRTEKLNINFSAIDKKASQLAEDINLKVDHTDSEITLKFITKRDLSSVKDLYFTDSHAVADPVLNQKFEKIDGGYSLTLKRNKPLGELVPMPKVVTGILFSKSGDIFGKSSLILTTAASIEEATKQSSVAPQKTTNSSNKEGFLGNVQKFNQAEKEKHKALYNGDEKINYVTLAQAKELIKGGKIKATEVQNGTDQTFFTAMFFAFIGGMLLNLMPCVFPVLGLKVMGFAQMSGNEPKKIKIHGLVFTFGVVASMWILAGAILTLKATLEKAGEGSIQWGAQMQNPIFLGLIIILLFVMGLNMYGVFEIGTKLTSAGSQLQTKKGYSGSFFSGILTTLIATPCSGPFLGAAMSYTLGLPAMEALLIFTVFALGISFPYLLLAFIPALINKLPRPGAWMEVMKKSMAFPLFATAIFFLGSFGSLTGINGMFWLAMAMVTAGMALWAYGTWGLPFTAKMKKYIWGFGFPAIVATFAGFMAAHAMGLKGESKDGWHPGVVEYHLSNNQPVWVDYTAEW